ncbi:unnamed protein product [Prunus armeniaca]
MDERTYNLIGADYPGNRAEDVKNPSLFSLVPLRKVFIAIALVLRDGLYNLVKIIVITLKKLCKKSNLPAVNEVNVDGAWRKDARIGGTVVIIRDCTGNFVAAGVHQIRNVGCPHQIEALALLDGLRLAASLDHDLFHFESDSLKTTTAVLKGGANFSLLGLATLLLIIIACIQKPPCIRKSCTSRAAMTGPASSARTVNTGDTPVSLTPS